METMRALQIKKAILQLSEVAEMEPDDIVARICNNDTTIFNRFKEASDIWEKFYKSDVRGLRVCRNVINEIERI